MRAFFKHCSRNRYALPLAGKPPAVFSDRRGIPVGQTRHEFVAVRRFGRGKNLFMVASFLPRRIFSSTVSANSTTSWNTSEYALSSVSGSTVEMSMPPTKTAPVSTSQKREASLTAVLLPEFATRRQVRHPTLLGHERHILKDALPIAICESHMVERQVIAMRLERFRPRLDRLAFNGPACDRD